MHRPDNGLKKWWSRRVLPPGPLRLFHGIIYRHIRQAGSTHVG